MATHSSVLAWRIPGTGEPRGLLSMGSHRVGHNWPDLEAAAAYVWNQKKKKGTNELIYKTETELKMQKTNTVTWGKVERDKWEIGIDIYILLLVQLPSHVRLFATPWTAPHQASLSLTISRSLLKFMSIASVMPSSHLILWRPLLLLSSILPSIRDFSKESAVHIRWPKYWSFSKSPSNEYSGLISFSIDRFDLLAVQRTLRTLSNTTVEGINSSVLSLLYRPALKTVCDQREDHSLDYMDFCQQRNVSAFKHTV